VQLDSWPVGFAQVTVGCFTAVPTRNGAGYMILNTFTFNGRGRGAIVRGSEGIVAGNTFKHMVFGAVWMYPGFDTREASFIQNVVVRVASNNVDLPSNLFTRQAF
jgi:hypothetical protein